jgi:predicted small metal-binding protein
MTMYCKAYFVKSVTDLSSIHYTYMKTLTCRDLGGPCEVKISGNSFEEIGEKCQTHVMEEISKGDKDHVEAIGKWKNMSEAQQAGMMEGFAKKYDEAPEE